MTSTAFDLARTVREVRRAGETFGVLLRRSFPASVEQLWRTCTDGDPLSRWLGRIEGDPGSGVCTLVMPAGRGEAIRTGISVLRCERPNRLDVRWSFDAADSVVSVRIEPDGSGASLTLEHYALTEKTAIERGPGWEEFLADLEDVLAGRPREHDCADLERQCDARWHGLPRIADHRFGEIDRSAGRFSISRSYPVDTDRLWTALATARGLGSWFGDASGELQPGGTWRVDFSGGYAHGRVESCSPCASFRVTYRQGIDPDTAASHTIEVGVTEAPGGSRLTLVHGCPADAGGPLLEGLAAGWVAHLNGLGTALQGTAPDENHWMADFTAARLVHRVAPSATIRGVAERVPESTDDRTLPAGP